jgi:hypothetical protein
VTEVSSAYGSRFSVVAFLARHAGVVSVGGVTVERDVLSGLGARHADLGQVLALGAMPRATKGWPVVLPDGVRSAEPEAIVAGLLRGPDDVTSFGSTVAGS